MGESSSLPGARTFASSKLAMATKLKLCGQSTVTSLSLSSSSPRSQLILPRSRVVYKQSTYPAYPSLVLAAKKSPKRLKYSAQRLNKEDALLYVEADPSGADSWKLDSVVNMLKEGAVGVIPTDTVYAMVCDVKCQDAISRLQRLKGIDSSKPLSILCRSFHDIDVYTTGFPRGDNQGHPDIFRAVRHCLPGPYTFILTASKALPKRCINFGTQTAKFAARKTIGVRMPDDELCKAILEKMDSPLISTSVKSPKEDDWIIDPVVIADTYGPEGLDIVVDGGIRAAEPSTVVDMTGILPIVIRRGKGPIQPWMVSGEDNEM